MPATVPPQVPAVAVSVLPVFAVPLIVGSTMFVGGCFRGGTAPAAPATTANAPTARTSV
jgi:hypothetical protein